MQNRCSMTKHHALGVLALGIEKKRRREIFYGRRCAPHKTRCSSNSCSGNAATLDQSARHRRRQTTSTRIGSHSTRSRMLRRAARRAGAGDRATATVAARQALRA